MLDLARAAVEITYLDPAIIAAAKDIVQREGGYVDDKNDSGGATNHGVSLVHARAQGKAFDIDKNGVIDERDIRLITPEMAQVDFLMCFFVEPQLNKLPVPLQFPAFDHAVNGGPGAAVRLVQTAVNSLRLNSVKQLVVDGQLGPNTMLAAQRALDAAGSVRLVNAFCDARVAEYNAIVARLPKNQKFLKGWLIRANLFRLKVK